MNWDNDVRREAVWNRQADAMIASAYPATGKASSPDWRLGFRGGWGVSREALLSDEAVERAARAVAGMEPGEDWRTNAEMGGGPTGTRDDEYRDACMEAARSVLTAALGEDEDDE